MRILIRALHLRRSEKKISQSRYSQPRQAVLIAISLSRRFQICGFTAAQEKLIKWLPTATAQLLSESTSGKLGEHALGAAATRARSGRMGKAKRAHQSRGPVGTARKGAPLPTLRAIPTDRT